MISIYKLGQLAAWIFAAALIICSRASATAPPPLPSPLDIRVELEDVQDIGSIFTVRITLENARDLVSGTLHLYLSEQLQLQEVFSAVSVSLAPGQSITRQFRTKIISENKHVIRASFVPDRTLAKKYGSPQVKKFIDFDNSTSNVLNKVGRAFWRDFATHYVNGKATKYSEPDSATTRLYRSPGLDASATIFGTVMYRLQETQNQNRLIPLPRTVVRISNTTCEPCAGYDPTWVQTDDMGNYSLSGWTYDFAFVDIFMSNDAGYIHEDGFPNVPDIFSERFFLDNISGQTITLDINIENSEPAHILRNMLVARDWSLEHLGYAVPNVRVKYEDGEDGETGSAGHSNGNLTIYEFIDGPNGPLPEVWNSRGRNVVAHEYGHAVMYHGYGGDMPKGSGPSPHFINSVSSRGFAWKEGWAAFMGTAAYVTSDTNEYAAFGWVQVSFQELDEVSTQGSCDGYYKGESCTYTDGRPVEGAVASVLYQ